MNVGVHEGIISMEEFETIQERLKIKKHIKIVKHDFVYRGLIKCADCGCSIVGVRKPNPVGEPYVYYTCSKRRGGCSQKPLKPEEIDQQVEDRLKAVSIDERVWELCKKLLKLHHTEQTSSLLDLQERWQSEMIGIEKKLNNLLDLHLGGDLSKVVYVEKKNKLMNERDILRAKLSDSTSSSDQARKQTEDFFGKAHGAYSMFKTGTLHQKKAMIQDIGWKLELQDGILTWEYKKPFDFLVEQKQEYVTVGNQFCRSVEKKNASAFAEATFWRTGRDSNPRSSP